MQIGIHAAQLGRNLNGAAVREFATVCEGAGVHSLWVSDHVCWPADIQSRVRRRMAAASGCGAKLWTSCCARALCLRLRAAGFLAH